MIWTKEAALEALICSAPPIGSVWRHYKGGRYEITGYGLFESTLEPTVEYRSADAPGVKWYRTLENFRSMAETAAGTVPRFRKE